MSNIHKRRRHLFAVSNSPNPTVGEYLARWLAGRRALRPGTVQSYETHIRRHITPLVGHASLDRLAPADVDGLVESLSEREPRLSATTINRIVATLHAALEQAVREGVIASNPASVVELPAVDPVRPEPWSAPELAAFLRATSSDRDYPLYLLLALTGVRRGEALGLTWRDLDLDAGWLTLRGQLSVVSSRPTRAPLKSRSGKRSVALDERLRLTMLEWQHAQQAEARAGGWTWSDDGWVFSQPDGSPRRPGEVTRRFQVQIAAVNARRIRLHDLRHTSAHVGLAAGETLLEVSRRLGHSSLAITADVYSEVDSGVAAASAIRLADLILAEEL